VPYVRVPEGWGSQRVACPLQLQLYRFKMQPIPRERTARALVLVPKSFKRKGQNQRAARLFPIAKA